MSHTTERVTYTTCDGCGRTEKEYDPPGWIAWTDKRPGAVKTGKLKHNCPACKAHGEERLMMGDPPG